MRASQCDEPTRDAAKARVEPFTGDRDRSRQMIAENHKARRVTWPSQVRTLLGRINIQPWRPANGGFPCFRCSPTGS